jgi:hypothetical protein
MYDQQPEQRAAKAAGEDFTTRGQSDLNDLAAPLSPTGWLDRFGIKQLSVPILAGAMILGGARIGVSEDELPAASDLRPTPAVLQIELEVPEGVTPEQIQHAAMHMSFADAHFEAGKTGDPFSELTNSQKEHVEFIVAAVAKALSPSPYVWQEQAAHQRFVRMLDALGADSYIAERDRGVDNLRSFFEQQRSTIEAEGVTPADLDNQSRAAFYLLASCEGVSQRLCEGRLVELQEKTTALGTQELKAYAQSNVTDMRLNFAQKQQNGEELLALKTIKGAVPLPAVLSLVSFQAEFLKREDARVEDNLTLYQCQIEGAESADWKIEIYYHGGTGFDVTLRNVEDATLFCSMNLSEFAEQVKDGSLEKRLERVVSNAVQERERADLMDAYDFPKDADVTYVRVFAPTGDKVIGSWIHTSMLLADAFESRYGDQFKTADHLLSSDPKTDIIQLVENTICDADKKQHFLIDLYEHGVHDKLGFPVELKAADLIEIVEKYPECTFDFTSIACFGGGLREGFEKELADKPELRDRVNLFLQTRPDEPNLTSRVTPTPGMEIPTRGSLYHFHMIQALLNDDFKSFGEVLRHADTETKKYVPVDGESIIKGKLITGIQGEDNPIVV